jgi:hypothetical protein
LLGADERFSAGGALGVIRMGARLYDPNLGRFLEADPIEGGSANSYDYCNAEPINCNDLDGSYGRMVAVFDAPWWGFFSGGDAEYYWAGTVGNPYAAKHGLGLQRHPRFNMPGGYTRIPDWRIGNHLIEVKSGNQSLTKHNRRQAEADAALVRQGFDVQWDFYPSFWGGISVSVPLMQYLLSHNISVIIHEPYVPGKPRI